jgi:hypothetical protein
MKPNYDKNECCRAQCVTAGLGFDAYEQDVVQLNCYCKYPGNITLNANVSASVLLIINDPREVCKSYVEEQ